MTQSQGNFLQKRDRPNTGYNYIGLAGRIAVGLGLHRETHNDVTQDRGRVQLRRRVLWILFYIESGFALTTGRPCLIDDDAIETPLPANLDDEVSWIIYTIGCFSDKYRT